MKFKDLTEEQIDFIKNSYNDKETGWGEKLFKISQSIGKSTRTVQNWVNKLGLTTPLEEPEYIQEAKKRKIDKTKKRFIITWAQNDTVVHKNFLKNIEAYAKFIDADIHIIAGRYKNPTSINSNKKDSWSREIIKYLDANRHDLHKYVSIMSDVKIQPTAVNPMSSMEGMSGINSCVFGSPKVQMQVISVLEGSMSKIMMTTGAITKINYTDSKAGKKGEFHHTYGFVIIEIQDEEKFHIRQVTANESGEFNDLYFNVKKEKVTRNEKIEAIVLGDVHIGDTDEVVMKSTLDLLKKLKPKYTVVHDLFNGKSISHHDLKNPIKMYQKEIEGSNSLRNEIERMLEWIDRMKKYNLVIVRSNHDDFLDRWILNSDWKFDVKNTMEYIDFTKILLENKAPKGLIPYIINTSFPNEVITLGRDESFKVKEWELGAHGDIGQNGSKGTLLQFRKINTKIVVGHYHCLPGEYKVQTKKSGWKEIRAIKQGDEILSYNPKTKKNEWNIVNEFIESDYKGTMLQIKGNGFEQTFTDKHMLMLNDGSYLPATEVICTRSASELPLLLLSEDIYKIESPKERLNKINEGYIKENKQINNGWGFNSYQANTKVYCVSVKNKCFWIQSAKTGQVSLTGNSPQRKDGALSVGTSTKLRLDYNIGTSNWLQSHVIIHTDGKAQHINFIDGDYTTFK